MQQERPGGSQTGLLDRSISEPRRHRPGEVGPPVLGLSCARRLESRRSYALGGAMERPTERLTGSANLLELLHVCRRDALAKELDPLQGGHLIVRLVVADEDLRAPRGAGLVPRSRGVGSSLCPEDAPSGS